MLKFQSRNLSTPECSSLQSRDETTEDCHPHRLWSSPSVPNLQYPWPANPPIAERPAASPPWMHCGPTVDPGPLRYSMKWKSRSPMSGSKQLQPMSTSTYQKAKTLLRNRQKVSIEKSHWRLQPLYWPNQRSGKTWADYYIQVVNRTLWPASAPEANCHHGLCTLRLQRSGTDGSPHPPGLSHLAETETPVMAARWVNHQVVGNGGRPVPHHRIPGNMWTEGLSTADRPQKKKKYKLCVFWVDQSLFGRGMKARKALVCLFTTLGNKEFVLNLLVCPVGLASSKTGMLKRRGGKEWKGEDVSVSDRIGDGTWTITFWLSWRQAYQHFFAKCALFQHKNMTDNVFGG